MVFCFVAKRLEGVQVQNSNDFFLPQTVGWLSRLLRLLTKKVFMGLGENEDGKCILKLLI